MNIFKIKKRFASGFTAAISCLLLCTTAMLPITAGAMEAPETDPNDGWEVYSDMFTGDGTWHFYDVPECGGGNTPTAPVVDRLYNVDRAAIARNHAVENGHASYSEGRTCHTLHDRSVHSPIGFGCRIVSRIRSILAEPWGSAKGCEFYVTVRYYW